MAALKDNLRDLPRGEQLSILREAIHHLVAGGNAEKARKLLTRFDFLEDKLVDLGVASVIEDFLLLREERSFGEILNAIRLAAPVLDRDADQLATQLQARLAARSHPDVVRLLDSVNPTSPWLLPLRPSLTPSGDSAEMVIAAATSQLPSLAISNAGIVVAEGEVLHVFDLDTGIRLKTLAGHQAPVRAIEVTADGSRAISLDASGDQRVWDLESFTLVDEHPQPRRFKITGDVRWPAGGRRAVVAERSVAISCEETGQLARLIGHFQPVVEMIATPDGRFLITANGGEKPFCIKVWDADGLDGSAEKGISRLTLVGHEGPISALAVSPDGSRLISASADRTLRLWDLTTGALLGTFRGHREAINDVAITGNGQRAVSASDDGTLRTWRLRTSSYSPPHSARVVSVDISPYGRYALSASADRRVKLWTLPDGTEHGELGMPREELRQAVFSPDGFHAVLASGDSVISVWDLRTETELRSFEGYELNGRSASWLEITADGGFGVAYFHDDGPLYRVAKSGETLVLLWDYHSGKELGRFHAPSPVRSIRVDPRANFLVACLHDQRLMIWRLRSKRHLGDLDESGTTCFITTTTHLLRGDAAGRIDIHDLSNGHRVKTLSLPDGPITGLAGDASGTLFVAVCADRNLRVFSLETGAQLASFGSDFAICDTSLSADGQTVIAGDEAGEVHLLRLEGLPVTSAVKAGRFPRRPPGIRSLSVTFEEKDDVKERGARWHPNFRHWYVPIGMALEPFKGWLQKPLFLEVPRHEIEESRKYGVCWHQALKKPFLPSGLDPNSVKQWIEWEYRPQLRPDLPRLDLPVNDPRNRTEGLEVLWELLDGMETFPEVELGPVEYMEYLYRTLVENRPWASLELWYPEGAARNGYKLAEPTIGPLLAWRAGPVGWPIRAAEWLTRRLPDSVSPPFYFEPYDDFVLSLATVEPLLGNPNMHYSGTVERHLKIEHVTILDVPLWEAEKAAKIGARWSPQMRRWYAPSPEVEEVCERWICHVEPLSWRILPTRDQHYFRRISRALATGSLIDPGDGSAEGILWEAVLHPIDQALATSASLQNPKELRRAALQTLKTAWYRWPRGCLGALQRASAHLAPQGLLDDERKDIEKAWNNVFEHLPNFDLDDEELPDDLDFLLGELRSEVSRRSHRLEETPESRRIPSGSEGLIDLDLSSRELWDLPMRVFSRPGSVRSLDLSNNSLENIPPEIALFERLEKLNLRGNRISFLPKELFELTALKHLDLGYNFEIRDIPSGISALRSLESLIVTDTLVESLPQELFKLEKLTELVLAENKIRDLPSTIRVLRNLECLDLSGNPITRLPAELAELPRLKTLFIGDLELEEAPPDLSHIDCVE